MTPPWFRPPAEAAKLYAALLRQIRKVEEMARATGRRIRPADTLDEQVAGLIEGKK